MVKILEEKSTIISYPTLSIKLESMTLMINKIYRKVNLILSSSFDCHFRTVFTGAFSCKINQYMYFCLSSTSQIH